MFQRYRKFLMLASSYRVSFRPWQMSIVVKHYSDVIITAMASQITGVSIVCSTICSGADKKHQSFSALAVVRKIHQWPLDSPYKGPVTRKMFSFDDVIMNYVALSFVQRLHVSHCLFSSKTYRTSYPSQTELFHAILYHHEAISMIYICLHGITDCKGSSEVIRVHIKECYLSGMGLEAAAEPDNIWSRRMPRKSVLQDLLLLSWWNEPQGLNPNNITSLVPIMAWRRTCDKPLSEPMMA